jgi:hypothetical protein
MTSGKASVTLKEGLRYSPSAQLRDLKGQAYYLIKADPEQSSIFQRNRYFALTEKGAVLDHSFRKTGATFAVEDAVTIHPGDLVVTKAVTTGPTKCSVWASYGGEHDGVANIHVVRSDGTGHLMGETDRFFMATLKTVTIAGVPIWIDRISPAAVMGRLTDISHLGCRSML